MILTKQRENSEVGLLLTGDDEIKELNRKYRDIYEATDVLSFSQVEGEKDFVFPDDYSVFLLGDIVISVDTAQRQSEFCGCSLNLELIRLIIHGFLHLLGYDHVKDEEESQKMQNKEKELLAYLEKDLL